MITTSSHKSFGPYQWGFRENHPNRRQHPRLSHRPRRAFELESLEPRLLLSADTIVPGLTGSLEDGLAGNPDNGVGDVLNEFVTGEAHFDNNVPGVRFDDVETGNANPSVEQTLSLTLIRKVFLHQKLWKTLMRTATAAAGRQ